jgi:hypothetical protein
MDTTPERRKRKGVVIVFVVILVVIAVGGLLAARTKSKIDSLQCANILASLGVAARLYAQDNGGMYALDVRRMSNEISNPNIPMCPSEKIKTPAVHFVDVCPSNTTYEYLVPGMKQSDRGTNGVFRCPIHGHVLREDGIVIRGDGTIQHGKATPF